MIIIVWYVQEMRDFGGRERKLYCEIVKAKYTVFLCHQHLKGSSKPLCWSHHHRHRDSADEDQKVMLA